MRVGIVRTDDAMYFILAFRMINIKVDNTLRYISSFAIYPS